MAKISFFDEVERECYNGFKIQNIALREGG